MTEERTLLKRHKHVFNFFATGCCLAVVAATLCSCNDKGTSANKPQLDFPYSINASVSYNEKEYKLSLSRNAEGFWSSSFSSPESLSGMTVTQLGDSYLIEHRELSFTLKQNDMPIKAIPVVIASSLDHASQASSVDIERDGKETVASGEITGGQYSLRIDKNGIPKMLELPGGMLVELTDFRKQ